MQPNFYPNIYITSINQSKERNKTGEDKKDQRATFLSLGIGHFSTLALTFRSTLPWSPSYARYFFNSIAKLALNLGELLALKHRNFGLLNSSMEPEIIDLSSYRVNSDYTYKNPLILLSYGFGNNHFILYFSFLSAKRRFDACHVIFKN